MKPIQFTKVKLNIGIKKIDMQIFKNNLMFREKQ